MTPNELARERYVNLVTFKKSGAEAKTPIWFAATTRPAGSSRVADHWR